MRRSTRVRCTNGRAIGRISEGPPGHTRFSVDRRGPGIKKTLLPIRRASSEDQRFFRAAATACANNSGLFRRRQAGRFRKAELLAPATANFRPGLVASIGIE
jgi:hypothetical protein